MTKHQWIKSIFSSHIDPETDEELKGTKIEMEGKIQKILKLIKDENEDESSNKEPLVELVEDFRKQYQSLYDRYDHLTGELRQKVHDKEKDSSSSSSSDSDSEKSHKIKSNKNGKRQNKNEKLTDGIRHELETANLEIVDLKSKLAAVSEENKALNSKYHVASLKLQEAEKEVERWIAEGERLKHESADILIDNKDLNMKLQCANEMEAQLNHQLEDVKNTMSILTLEKEAATSTTEEEKKVNDDLRSVTAQLRDEKEVLQLELDAVKGEVYVTKENLQSAQQEIENLTQTQKITEEEKNSLSSKVVVLSEEINQAHHKIQDLVTESSQLREKLGSRETELLTYKEMHEAHLSEADTRTRDLQLNLETMQSHKTEIEKQKDDELSALFMKLEDKERDFLSQIQHMTAEKSMLSEEIKQLQDKIQELVTESSQMRDKMDSRETELLTYKEMHEDKERDFLSQIQHLTAEKSMLSEEIKQLQDKIQELVTESSQMRDKMDGRETELLTYKEMHEAYVRETDARTRDLEQRFETLHLHKTEMEKEKDSELSALFMKLEDREKDLLSQTQQLTAEKSMLSEETKQLQDKIQELVTESSKLRETLDDKETELLTYKEMHEAHLSEADTRTRDLQLNLETMQSHKTEIEKQKDDELSALFMKLEDKERDFLSQIQHLTAEKAMLTEEIKQLQDKIQELVTESSQMRDKMDGRETELLTYKEMHEAYVRETDARTRDLEQKFETLHLHKTEMEKEKDSELSALFMKLEDKEKDLLSQTQQLTAEKSRLSEETKQLEDKIQELVTESSKSRETLDDKERDFLTLKGIHESQENEATNRIRNLELELETLHSQKHETEKQKDNELSLLLTRLEDKEKDAIFQLELLKEDVNNLQFKVETLQTQKGELEELLVQKTNEASSQFNELMIQINEKQCELESLQSLKVESDLQLEKKDLETSEYLIQIESLKEELSRKTVDQLKMQEENEGHIRLGKDLEFQVDMAQNKIKELEEQLGEQTCEIDQLRKENEDLKDKISELVKTLSEREEQFSALEKKLEDASNEASAQIDASAIQINKLQQELESLHAEKKQLELLAEKDKQESAKSLTVIEDQNIELVRKIKEQENMLKEQEVAFNELTEVHIQLEVCFEECKENLLAAERKIEELTNEFSNSTESNARKFNELEEIFKEVERELEIKRDELEETIEDLKRELEMKGDEVITLTENVRNIEVKLRLSNQKLRITEQLLSEKENEHIVKEEKYQKDNKVLHERILVLSGVVGAYKEDQFRMKAVFTEQVNQTFTELDALTMKLEEDSGHIETCVFEILNELQVAKSWVTEKNNNEENQNQKITNLIYELNSVRQQESLLREQIENLVKAVKQLELRMEKSKNEKDEKIGEMEKRLNEKDEWILGLGEEKKEAIRQLCIWNDYHRERCVYLETFITNRIGSRRQITT